MGDSVQDKMADGGSDLTVAFVFALVSHLVE